MSNLSGEHRPSQGLCSTEQDVSLFRRMRLGLFIIVKQADVRLLVRLSRRKAWARLDETVLMHSYVKAIPASYLTAPTCISNLAFERQGSIERVEGIDSSGYAHTSLVHHKPDEDRLTTFVLHLRTLSDEHGIHRPDSRLLGCQGQETIEQLKDVLLRELEQQV